MLDFNGSPVFIFVPFIAFSVIFLLIVLLKSCIVMSYSRSEINSDWSNHHRRRGIRRRQNTINQSTTSVEIHNNFQSPPVQFISPPGYYSEVMATDASATYPVYVPPYATQHGISPVMSIRDPNLFEGIPGLQAPPPYPPPPTYSQIQNFPELPSVSNSRLENRLPSRGGKKLEGITPVE